MKFGGTPLHWSCSREAIEALISMGYDINSCNFDGRTALHIMVLRNRLDCVVALLSHGADTDIGDREGNTPLHLAVTQGSFAIVQALVVFGANLSYKYEYLQCYLHFSALIRRYSALSIIQANGRAGDAQIFEK
jgi:calcium-independent phospholipase A2